MIVLAVTVRAQPGKGDELAKIMAEQIQWVADNEPDTLTYALSRSKDDPDRFLVFERYGSPETLAAHNSSPRMAELVKNTTPLVAGPPEILVFDEVAAKI